MPTDWADQVRAAITNLEIKADRVLEPDQALAIIATQRQRRTRSRLLLGQIRQGV
jgi:hypothetical protein